MRLLVITSGLLFCCHCATAVVFATQQGQPAQKVFAQEARRAASEPTREARASSTQPDLSITSQTEIRLNGERCQYNEVPANAVIQLLEIAPDRRTVLRIHFGSSK